MSKNENLPDEVKELKVDNEKLVMLMKRMRNQSNSRKRVNEVLKRQKRQLESRLEEMTNQKCKAVAELGEANRLLEGSDKTLRKENLELQDEIESLNQERNLLIGKIEDFEVQKQMEEKKDVLLQQERKNNVALHLMLREITILSHTKKFQERYQKRFEHADLVKNLRSLIQTRNEASHGKEPDSLRERNELERLRCDQANRFDDRQRMIKSLENRGTDSDSDFVDSYRLIQESLSLHFENQRRAAEWNRVNEMNARDQMSKALLEQETKSQKQEENIDHCRSRTTKYARHMNNLRNRIAELKKEKDIIQSSVDAERKELRETVEFLECEKTQLQEKLKMTKELLAEKIDKEKHVESESQKKKENVESSTESTSYKHLYNYEKEKCLALDAQVTFLEEEIRRIGKNHNDDDDDEKLNELNCLKSLMDEISADVKKKEEFFKYEYSKLLLDAKRKCVENKKSKKRRCSSGIKKSNKSWRRNIVKPADRNNVDVIRGVEEVMNDSLDWMDDDRSESSDADDEQEDREYEEENVRQENMRLIRKIKDVILDKEEEKNMYEQEFEVWSKERSEMRCSVVYFKKKFEMEQKERMLSDSKILKLRSINKDLYDENGKLRRIYENNVIKPSCAFAAKLKNILTDHEQVLNRDGVRMDSYLKRIEGMKKNVNTVLCEVKHYDEERKFNLKKKERPEMISDKRLDEIRKIAGGGNIQEKKKEDVKQRKLAQKKRQHSENNLLYYNPQYSELKKKLKTVQSVVKQQYFWNVDTDTNRKNNVNQKKKMRRQKDPFQSPELQSHTQSPFKEQEEEEEDSEVTRKLNFEEEENNNKRHSLGMVAVISGFGAQKKNSPVTISRSSIARARKNHMNRKKNRPFRRTSSQSCPSPYGNNKNYFMKRKLQFNSSQKKKGKTSPYNMRYRVNCFGEETQDELEAVLLNQKKKKQRYGFMSKSPRFGNDKRVTIMF